MLRTNLRLVSAWAPLCVVIACVSGCSGDDAAPRAMLASNDGVEYAPPEAPLEIEESDLYRLDDQWLYVQSARSGLSVIDVSLPRQPVLKHQIPLRGRAGELYVDDGAAILMLEEASPPCELEAPFQNGMIATTSQVVGVADAAVEPLVGAPACLPGSIVASRKIDDFVYVVTSHEPLQLTWAFAVDVSAVLRPQVTDMVVMENAENEVHVTDTAIYLAQRDWENPQNGPDSGSTTVRYLSLEPSDGTLRERGSFDVPGVPAGRFHMSALGNTLRIVTRGEFRQGSNLHVIDFTDPDRPWVTGSLTGIAPQEDLHATRFEGDRAYVVTYEPIVKQTDPLWVISLEKPSAPKILGELEIPGWSDYVFPRGKQLVAVGRGDRGDQVAVSLFDVSDPSLPQELDRLALGTANATSEANTDFRGISILEEHAGGGPLILVPYTNELWTDDHCTPEHHLQLIDLNPSYLSQRGTSSDHSGAIRRAIPVDDSLYTVGEQEVTALDIANRDQPSPVAKIRIANGKPPKTCTAPRPWTEWENEAWVDDSGHGLYCSMKKPSPSGPSKGLLGSAMLLGLAWLYRRRSVHT